MAKPKIKRPAKDRPSLTIRDQNVVLSDVYESQLTGIGGVKDPLRRYSFSRLGAITPREIDALFREDWLTRKIVEVVADDATREWIIFKSDNAKVNKKLKDELKRLQVKRKVRQANLLGRLYGAGIIIPAFTDGSGAISRKVNLQNVTPIRNLHVLDSTRMTIDSYARNPFDDTGFGEPLIYKAAGGNQRKVHASRVAVFEGKFIPNNERQRNSGWPDSVIVSIEDALKTHGTSLRAGALIIQDFVTKTLKLPKFAELAKTADGREGLKQRLLLAQEMQSVLGITIVGEDEEYKKIQTPVAGLHKLLDTFIDQVSSSSGIIRPRLFTQQLGTLAGAEEATRTHYDFIKAYQESNLRRPLEQLIELILASMGEQGLEWELQFAPLWQISESKKADANKRQAETLMILIQNTMITPAEGRELAAKYGIYSEFDIDTKKKVPGADLPPNAKQPNQTAFVPNERPSKTDDQEGQHAH